MKYIRTKDYGVCKVKNEDKLTISYENSWINGCLWKDSYKDQIRYANTIEELCDAYFAISNTDHKTPIKIDFEKKNIYQWQGDRLVVPYTFEQFIPYHTIYGAIWTDKGLIYVAKMNEKGELELL